MLQIKQHPSPNFDMRGGVVPSIILLHYTGMETAAQALARLCDAQAKVSSHYFIDEDGAVWQLVDEVHRAWHAGKSFWRGERDINAHSIGIEIVNPGHEFGYRSFSAPQIESVIALCKVIQGRYKGARGAVIGGMEILAHSDVAPIRKTDPGELFPWKKLAAAGVGDWPKPDALDMQAAQDMAADKVAMHALLREYGYDADAPFESVLVAYHRHFYPEKFRNGGDPSEMDQVGAARLLALLRMRHGS